VFEPLVGELFRSQLVMHAAPRNGDFVTPTVVGAEEYDFAERDLRYTIPLFHCSPATVSSPTTTRHSCRTGRPCGPAAPSPPPDAAATVVAAGLQAAALRGQPGRGEEPFRRILTDLNLDAPKELGQ